MPASNNPFHWLSRRVLRLPITRPRLARAVDEELAFHLEGRIEELIAAGMSPQDAAAVAQRRFGAIGSVRDSCVAIDERGLRRASAANMWSAIGQDVRFAVRSLRRRPSFAATVLLTLTLGVAATTAMFSVIDGVLLEPLPYRDPGKLVAIYTTFPQWKGKPVVGEKWNSLKSPYEDYVRLASGGGQRAFDAIAGFEISDASLAVGQETVAINEGSATANLLPVLGTTMLSGRWFLPGEDGPGATRVTVVSCELWQGRFGGASIVGNIIKVDEESFKVIGILPPRFSLTGDLVETNGAHRADLWIPFGVYPSDLKPNNYKLELIGRLRPGVSLAAASAIVEPLLRGQRQAAKSGSRLVSRAEAETGAVKRPLLLLFAAVGLLLLITAGNVAALFLSECAMRENELRTRAVLGAGRLRLVRLLLTESAAIAAAGSACGALLGWWSARILVALAPRELPHAAMVHMNIRVCAFTVAIAVVVAILSGIAPAFTFTRSGAFDRLSGGRVAAGRSPLQSAVVSIQAAMTVVLIAGATLLARSLINQQRTNLGFAPGSILMMRVDLPSSLDHSGADRLRLYDQAAQAVGALGGARRVSAASKPPLSGSINGQMVSPKPDEKMSISGADAERMVVLPNYFDVLRIPLIAGRMLSDQDIDGSPLVAVVSERFARRFWPNESALGKPFRHPNGVATVVGIVGDVKNKTLDQPGEGVFYLPEAQSGAAMALLVETRGDPAALSVAAQRAVWSAVPGSTISEVSSMAALVNRALAPARYRATLAGIFAGLALLVTAVGVAGLSARAVSTRIKELCIRMALGATLPRALALALARGVAAIAIGIMVGIVVTPFTSRWLAEYLFEVAPRDTVTYVATCVVTMGVSASATVLATKRLWRTDLVSTLREGG